MIRLENLTKSYSDNGPAVDNISLNVRKGEIFGFIGPNGAGKSTTIKMITGILPPSSGHIYINGTNLLKYPLKAKKSLGYVPDQHEIFDRLTAIEYLNYIADLYRVPTDVRTPRIKKYLEMFEIAHAAGELIKSFSHGMKQKLTLTGALIHNPSLWILDEPLVGLDPKSAMLLKKEMRAHCSAGNTVFFSTHVLEVAERLCDRIGIIYGGKLIAVGTLEELKGNSSNQTLENIFFELTDTVEVS